MMSVLHARYVAPCVRCVIGGSDFRRSNRTRLERRIMDRSI